MIKICRVKNKSSYVKSIVLINRYVIIKVPEGYDNYL